MHQIQSVILQRFLMRYDIYYFVVDLKFINELQIHNSFLCGFNVT